MTFREKLGDFVFTHFRPIVGILITLILVVSVFSVTAFFNFGGILDSVKDKTADANTNPTPTVSQTPEATVTATDTPTTTPSITETPIVTTTNAATPIPTTTVKATPKPTTAPVATTVKDWTGVNLRVEAGTNKTAFSKEMLGLGYVNWEHSWGKPFLGQNATITQATKALNPGVIRYAGGGWANSVGWDRTNQRTPYTAWQYPGDNSTYYFHYGKDEIDSLATFANQVGSKVMIQVNVSNNNPAMWADMVRYTNIEKGYKFKYWELGNEFDFDTDKGVTPQIYAQRVAAYKSAMKAVDSSIVIVSGVTAYTILEEGANTTLSDYLRLTGSTTDSASIHWYQQCNTDTLTDALRYEWPNTATNAWLNRYSRKWADIIVARIKSEILSNSAKPIGITELNMDACNHDNKANSNQFGAVWLADAIGRLAYNGLSYSTVYEGYGEQSYAVIKKDPETGVITLSSTYYTLLMYNKFFGNQMVQSSTTDNNLTIWASKGTDGNVHLMVTNLTGNEMTTKVGVNNAVAKTAKIYKMTGNQSGTSLDQTTQSKINGVALSVSNVEGSLATVQPISVAMSGNVLSYTFPKYSVTAIIVE